MYLQELPVSFPCKSHELHVFISLYITVPPKVYFPESGFQVEGKGLHHASLCERP